MFSQSQPTSPTWVSLLKHVLFQLHPGDGSNTTFGHGATAPLQEGSFALHSIEIGTPHNSGFSWNTMRKVLPTPSVQPGPPI